MENDNAVIVAGIFLGVCLAVLLIIKIVSFFMEFNDVVRYITGEMRRAGDDDEYRYWRRELRCHYLCLIPFVTERNVMRVYKKVFYKPKHMAPVKRTDGLYHVLAPSVLGIFICAVCLCSASWAWFTASTSTGTTAIQSASYKLLYQVGEDTTATELAADGTTYSMTEGNCAITLNATGTTGATGYCSIKVGDETYCTEQILADCTFAFTVKAAAGTEITLTPKWGTYSGTATIQNNGAITATGSLQSSTQTPDNAVTTEPAAPTSPTTPENTTEAQNEPPTTEESENN